MESIGIHLQNEAILQNLTDDVVKSSEIEGEILDPNLVRSSVARHLGMDIGALDTKDKNIEGVVEMVLDATQKFDEPLTKERLFQWHRSLFPSKYVRLRVGDWRAGPVDVISGPIGRETVHFEAPPAERVDREMGEFLAWINEEKCLDLVLKSAIAHLWFITIHPFEDGNGRIGRAIADLVLARSENSPKRFYSLSSQIQRDRNSYYEHLEKTQKGSLEITSWITWFFECLERAVERASATLIAVKMKGTYWKKLDKISLNERQRKIIILLLDGFEGKLNTSKWAKITKCSQDTAYRDIADLVEKGILVKNPEGGRSTSYSLKDLL